MTRKKFDPPTPPPTPDSPTVGEFFGMTVPPVDPSLPKLPGFEMSDEPFEEVDEETDPALDPAQQNSALAPAPMPRRASALRAEAEAEDLGYGMVAMPVPPAPTLANVSYESRITIVEAFRYTGSFKGAPDWVNRNWLSHGDYDPLRKIEPGPALRVPLPSGVVYARIGDYVVIQSVLLSPGLEPEKRLEVWPAETFQKLFVPKPANASERSEADKPTKPNLPNRPGGGSGPKIKSTPPRLSGASAPPEA